MPDAATHTSVAILTGAGSAAMTAGAFFGIEYYLIGVALLGAAVSHIYVTSKMSMIKLALSIFGSAVLGIMASHFSYDVVLGIAEAATPAIFAGLKSASVGGKVFVAFWVSFLAQKGVPILFRWLDKKGTDLK